MKEIQKQITYSSASDKYKNKDGKFLNAEKIMRQAAVQNRENGKITQAFHAKKNREIIVGQKKFKSKLTFRRQVTKRQTRRTVRTRPAAIPLTITKMWLGEAVSE